MKTDAGTEAPEIESASVLPGYTLWKQKFSAPLSRGDARGMPRINITLTLLEVTKSKGETEFFNNLLYSGNGPEQYRNAMVREYQAMYRQIPMAAILPNAPSADWEYWEIIEISAFRDRGLTLGREQYVYSGGAHGMQTKTYYVIDREKLKTLTLADFFREPEGAPLRGFVTEELRHYSGLAKDAPLSTGIFFEDEPEISANFCITDQGLSLRWNPYEIAPYSEGGVEITLPWRTIRPHLTHEAMELLAVFGIYLFV